MCSEVSTFGSWELLRDDVAMAYDVMEMRADAKPVFPGPYQSP